MKMSMDFLSNVVIKRVRSVLTMYSEKDAGVKRYNRPTWALLLKYEGQTVYTVNGRQYVSDINNAVILPKGSSYEWKCTEAGHYTVIEFDSDSSYNGIFSFPVKNAEKLLKAFQELEYKRTLKRPLTELESIRDAYSVMLRIIESEPSRYLPTEKQRILTPTFEYIAKNYTKRIKNEELAAIAGVSTVYFRKLFCELTGQPPIDYICTLRIKKAKEMLRSDHGSIGEIASALGYSNIYDFSRAFKKHTGLSPSQYSKKHH